MGGDWRPLAGIRVLDLTRLFPGAYCTLLLARLGAEVIKVEAPQGGDPLRSVPPARGETGAMFAALNAGKRSITLDLRSPRGRDLLLRLARTAQVLVEGNRPGVMTRLGAGWEALQAVNPSLVLCSITGYGQDGPGARRAGHDLNYLARAGALALNGTPADPLPYGMQVADFAAGGLGAALQIVAACLDVAGGGRGRHLDVSMALGAADLTLAQRAVAAANGRPPQRGGELLTGRYPCYRVYACKGGGHFTVAALEPKFWANLCRALELPDLVGAQFAEGEVGAQAHAALEDTFARRSREEWAERLGPLDVCCEPVLDVTEADLPSPFGAPPPALGEGTRALLEEIGAGPEYPALQAEGVV